MVEARIRPAGRHVGERLQQNGHADNFGSGGCEP
jgi:hypothetical protein